jgi:hypothetical protein
LKILSTDYQFGTVLEASEKMGYFFGQEMKKQVLLDDKTIIPEWTGVWKVQFTKKLLGKLN